MRFLDKITQVVHNHTQHHEIGNFVMPYLTILLTLVFIISILNINQRINENANTIAEMQALSKSICQHSNQVNAVISQALKASLTEPDVQANKPQAQSYKEVINKLAVPEDCN